MLIEEAISPVVRLSVVYSHEGYAFLIGQRSRGEDGTLRLTFKEGSKRIYVFSEIIFQGAKVINIAHLPALESEETPRW